MSGHRILVVEDEASLCSYYVEVLQKAGYETRAAATYETALKLTREYQPHLVVLDLYLGHELDGFDVLAALRRQNDQTAVMVLTAYGNEARLVRALDLGADNFVSKPVSREHLLARVRAQLRLRRDPGQGYRTGWFRYGDVVIDLSVGQVRHLTTNQRQALSEPERKVLSLLLAAPGAIVPYEALLRQVWKLDLQSNATYVMTKPVRTTIFRIRSKLKLSGDRDVLTVVYETGVAIRPPDEVHADESPDVGR
jgi:DNA-binding response OmpR family regulator